MYPSANKVYVPNFYVKERDVTIEEVRSNGKIVAISDDGTRATVQVTVGLTVCYCGVTLDSEGKICEFIPRTNKVFTRLKSTDISKALQELEKPPE